MSDKNQRDKDVVAAHEDYRADLADGIEAYGGTIPPDLQDQVKKDRAARDARRSGKP